MDRLMQFLTNVDRQAPEFSSEALALALLLSFVLGQVIAFTYNRTHTGLSYSRSFTQSLVLMMMVVSLVMFVIGNNIITAFGLIGALALIRFRNVLKDTRDTVFVFIALVMGMAAGSQRFTTASSSPLTQGGSSCATNSPPGGSISFTFGQSFRRRGDAHPGSSLRAS